MISLWRNPIFSPLTVVSEKISQRCFLIRQAPQWRGWDEDRILHVKYLYSLTTIPRIWRNNLLRIKHKILLPQTNWKWLKIDRFLTEISVKIAHLILHFYKNNPKQQQYNYQSFSGQAEDFRGLERLWKISSWREVRKETHNGIHSITEELGKKPSRHHLNVCDQYQSFSSHFTSLTPTTDKIWPILKGKV